MTPREIAKALSVLQLTITARTMRIDDDRSDDLLPRSRGFALGAGVPLEHLKSVKDMTPQEMYDMIREESDVTNP